MAVPSSGAITLGKIGKEVRATNFSNNYDNGPHTSSETALADASNGVYGALNQLNPSQNRPNGASPHLMSEWYSYDHLISS